MAAIPSTPNINRFDFGIGLSLDLQFAADKTLTARKGPTPVFIRASTATFVGGNGLIQSAADNEARFDHDPVTLTSKGLLIEELRTNQSLRSEDIVNNVGWSLVDATSVVSGTSPNGNSSYQISETNTTANHLLVNTGGNTGTGATSVVSGTNYTGSIFVKKVVGSVDWVQLTFGFTGFGTAQFANFNISNGTIGNYAGLTSGTIPRIEEFPNDWYRCSITATATATTSSTSNIILSFINNTDILTRFLSYLGSTSNSVLASLCQVEAGSFPTSYIPTISASGIRSADVCSITGANFTGFYNQSEGTLFAECQIPTANQNAGIAVIGTTSFNHNIALFKSDTTGGSPGNRFVPYVTLAGTLVAKHDFGDESGNGNLKVLASVSLNNMIFARNGTLSPLDSIAAMPTPNRITIGGRADGIYINGHIARIKYFRKRLPDAKLITLTT